MSKFAILSKYFAFSFALLICQPLWADEYSHTLDSSQSHINFISVKKEHVVEVSSFGQFEGGISDAGDVSVRIDLTSVNTGIGIRDDRLKRELFESDIFPSATINAKIDPKILSALNEPQSISVEGTLDLHGVSQPVLLELRLLVLQNGDVLVHSTKPVVVATEQYGLDKGVDVLSELVGGISIGKTVPVNFSLHFKP